MQLPRVVQDPTNPEQSFHLLDTKKWFGRGWQMHVCLTHTELNKKEQRRALKSQRTSLPANSSISFCAGTEILHLCYSGHTKPYMHAALTKAVVVAAWVRNAPGAVLVLQG